MCQTSVQTPPLPLGQWEEPYLPSPVGPDTQALPSLGRQVFVTFLQSTEL